MRDKLKIRHYLAILSPCLVAGCVNAADHQPQNDKKNASEISGIFFSGEHGYFRARDGTYFTLRVPDPKDRAVFLKLAPLTIAPEEVCISMRMRGERNAQKDDLNREILVVSKISEAKRVACPE